MSISNKPKWSTFFKLWPAIFLLSLCLSCEGPGGVRYIKLGHGLDTSHPVHEAMVFLAERVEEKSGGEMVVQVYPNQQLGTERELMELLDRKSTRLNSSHVRISYAVFCLKKKKKKKRK